MLQHGNSVAKALLELFPSIGLDPAKIKARCNLPPLLLFPSLIFLFFAEIDLSHETLLLSHTSLAIEYKVCIASIFSQSGQHIGIIIKFLNTKYICFISIIIILSLSKRLEILIKFILKYKNIELIAILMQSYCIRVQSLYSNHCLSKWPTYCCTRLVFLPLCAQIAFLSQKRT
jgi:hypothetical protein